MDWGPNLSELASSHISTLVSICVSAPSNQVPQSWDGNTGQRVLEHPAIVLSTRNQ